MYVTRPLSLYYNSPDAITEMPPEGPNSGILVIEDPEAEEKKTCFFGLFNTTRLSDTPFPQNKMIKVRYSTGAGENQRTYYDDAYFIPALGKPLSSNHYYVVRAHGRYKGKTCTCSKEEDMSTFCLCTFIDDIKPSPFDHRNIYQQVEIVPQNNRFRAVSVVSDGIPQRFLRRKGWRAYTSRPSHYSLKVVNGMNTSLRMQMPPLDFVIKTKFSPSLVVGKWYCPYIFVKEGERLKDQMKMSMFYEMTLEQYWEEIFTDENFFDDGKVVNVDVMVRKEVAMLDGNEDVKENFDIVEGVIWFMPTNSLVKGIGLSLPIWERIRWEEGRGGYVGDEKKEKVKRIELYEGKDRWRNFGCYVLVERFVLRRMDGSLALSYEFKHTDKIRIKWE